MKMEEIEKELREHNRNIGTLRSEDRLKSDAKFVAMVRHEGISIETVCMMLSDAMAILKIRRDDLADAERRGELAGLRKAAKVNCAYCHIGMPFQDRVFDTLGHINCMPCTSSNIHDLIAKLEQENV